MTGWNLADVWETVADQIPDAACLVHAAAPGGSPAARRLSWSEVDRRADALARFLLDAGLPRQAKVAQYLPNQPAYLESLWACAKAGLAPVNTNYRYLDDELVSLWTNADVETVVFDRAFTERADAVRARVPGVRTWLWVDPDATAGTGHEAECPPWAVPYEQVVATETGRTRAPWGRSPDDLLLLYTGGTTGLPKGVMWRQDDVFCLLDAANRRPLGPTQDLAALAAARRRPGPPSCAASPLMHGTALFTALNAWSLGGSVVTLRGRRFDAPELLDALTTEQIAGVTIVGDAFARPLVEALDAEPDRWDLAALRVVTSSGVMWSAETKQALARHAPNALFVDILGSSEALGVGRSVSAAGAETAPTARFELGAHTRVIDDEGNDVVPGSGQVGRLAVRGRGPIGYYKDPAASARTFTTVGGVRYTVPGDWARVEADGTLTLLGRGSVCINTGGEKVFCEEVEEVLKQAPGVRDAVAVGVPDLRLGESVTAVVEAEPGADPDEEATIAFVKARLAGYKAPRRVVVVDTIDRAPNGKVDYPRLRALAAERTAPAAGTPAVTTASPDSAGPAAPTTS